MPHAPSRARLSLKNYYHPGPELFISGKDANGLTIEACQGDGEGCSLNRYGDNFSVDDHLAYLDYDYTNVTCQQIRRGGKHEISSPERKKEYDNLKSWIIKYCASVACKNKTIPGDLDCNVNNILNCSKPAHLETAAEAKKSQHNLKDFVCWACTKLKK